MGGIFPSSLPTASKHRTFEGCKACRARSGGSNSGLKV